MLISIYCFLLLAFTMKIDANFPALEIQIMIAGLRTIEARQQEKRIILAFVAHR